MTKKPHPKKSSPKPGDKRPPLCRKCLMPMGKDPKTHVCDQEVYR
jgi:hypothetical protein